MEMTKEKSYKIQVLRGLAIIAVVLIHNTPGGIAQVWCRPFLNFSVGLFLFMSAMLSSVEKWNPKKRILRNDAIVLNSGLVQEVCGVGLLQKGITDVFVG